MKLVRQPTSLIIPAAPVETRTLTTLASRALRPTRLCMLACSSSWPPPFTMQSLGDLVVHRSSLLAAVEVSFFSLAIKGQDEDKTRVGSMGAKEKMRAVKKG